MELSLNDVFNSLIVVWVVWVSGAAGVVTFAANKQRKTNNAAFAKIRQLEEKLKQKE